MEKGMTIAGNLIVDYVKTIDSYPQIGMLSSITNITKCVGGCAANTLVDIAKMDPLVPLQCIGTVGDDENGQYVLSVLDEHNIDIRSVRKSGEAPTSFTDVMSVRDTGERTFFHARGANATFSIDDIDFNKIKGDMFHIGYALLLDSFDKSDREYGTVMAKALCFAKEKGLKTSMDVVSENSNRFEGVVSSSLKYCDYFIANEIESSMISNIPARDNQGKIISENMKLICEALFAKGVNEMAVIHAPEGGWLMDRRGKFTFVPALDLPHGYIKGTVGAGDAFCAGMLYSIYKELDAEKALRLASAAAAACLSHENSIDGMRKISEIMELEKKFMRYDQTI